MFNSDISSKNKSLVFVFLITFSRFEFALKNSIEFATSNKSGVKPNWDKFCNSLENLFNKSNSRDLSEAVDYLLNNPPKIQHLENNTIIWQDRIFDNTTSIMNQLNLHIRTIRNNLFHGGKINGKSEKELVRDFNLLNSAMIILNEWLTLNEKVKRLFLTNI